ncbi:MAG: DUF1049 domain-containing protein [Propionivibrio sp.]|nr:DUF1049 domain-containing protein [Propionivibrio sp.]
MQLLTIFAMLAAAAGVLFALQNHETVALSLFVWNFKASLAIVVLLALALGGLVVALVSTPATLRRQWAMGRQQKRIEELELRVATLQKEVAEAGRSADSTATATANTSPYKEMPQLISGNSNTL